MKRYLFIVILLLLMLCHAYLAFPSVKDIEFINREYALDSKYLPQLIGFSLEHDIRIESLHNWIMAESSGRERAYNKKSRDYGLCQLHDVDYLVNKYWHGQEPFDIWNGEHNLFVALAYLSDLIDRRGVYYGFMAYNIGPGRVSRGQILNCGIEYVAKILPEEITPITIDFIGDNSRLIITFTYKELFDDRRQWV